jgi:hypothetical protein
VAYPQAEIGLQTIFKVCRLVIVFSGGTRTFRELQSGCKDFVKIFTSMLHEVIFHCGNRPWSASAFHAGKIIAVEMEEC